MALNGMRKLKSEHKEVRALLHVMSKKIKASHNVLSAQHIGNLTTHSLTHSLTHLLIHSLTYLLSHSLTYSPTHSLTHSLR
jgi:hypothetical protein